MRPEDELHAPGTGVTLDPRLLSTATPEDGTNNPLTDYSGGNGRPTAPRGETYPTHTNVTSLAAGSGLETEREAENSALGGDSINPLSFSPEVLPKGPAPEHHMRTTSGTDFDTLVADPLPLPASLPAPSPMESQVTKHGDADIILLTGTLDPKGAAEAKKALAPFLTGGTKLVIDMSGVDYIGSAGLRELFLAAKTIDRVGGKLAVCALRPEVKRIFDIAGFAIPYQIVESRETAYDVLGVQGAA